MARWRQIWDKETQTSHFVPIDEAARSRDSIAIHGDIDSFVSPIDGTVISDRKQMREHCEKHNVVPADEFTPEFYEQKAKERERLYNGEHTRQESYKRKQEIYNNWVEAERKHGY